ncbi:MAG: serine hydrolase [Bacteroidota bacterium]
MHYLFPLLFSFWCSSLSAQDLYFPPPNLTGEWATMDPAELGYCSEEINTLYQFLEDNNTKSFILLKDGKIVLEQYFGTYTQDSLYVWNSAGKSLRAVLLGIAQEQGFLDINDPTSDYLGAGWTNATPEQESQITIWNQITMTTGLNPLYGHCTDPECLRYLNDPAAFWFYHNAPYSLTKEVLEASTGQTLNALTNSWIEAPLGMGLSFWFEFGYNTIYLSRARDMARFGLLMQAGGEWDGTTVLGDTAYLNAMIEPSQDLNPSYGYLWWLAGEDSHIMPGGLQSFPGSLSPNAPDDLYLAAGKDGQYIGISPANGLVMVRQGPSPDTSATAVTLHDQIWEYLNALTCSPNSVAEAQLEGLSIYPNPVQTNRVWVKGLGATGAELQLFDQNGRLLAQRYSARTISIAEFPAGSYHLKVLVPGAERSFQIVKP